MAVNEISMNKGRQGLHGHKHPIQVADELFSSAQVH